MNGEIVAFDYTALTKENAAELERSASRIRSLVERMSINIIAIGGELAVAKDKLGHGRFMGWLEAEFRWSDRTARRFMRAAAVLGDRVDTVSVLEPNAIYLLSAPSTPEPAREDVLRRLDRGEKLSASRVKVIVEGARGEKPKAVSPMARLRDRIVQLEEKLRAAEEQRKHIGGGDNID